MKQTVFDVKKIAKVACIAISQSEVQKKTEELEKIFAWLGQIFEVDTTGIEPMVSVHDSVERVFLDKDYSFQQLQDKHDVLSNCTNKNDSFIFVPKVLE